jgi:hypothetical protein
MDVTPRSPINLKFVLSAALVAIGIRLAVREPISAAVAAVLVALMLVPSFLARRRVREVLRSGDVRSVLSAWSGNLSKLPHPETMGPLVTAAAFASCGWVEQARTALDRSVRGPAWDAALEHRLFVETLLDAFEGDREGALHKASRLSSLPMPPTGPFMQGRVRVLRDALAAFARAFAHTSKPDDMDLLERASRKSPLVHWAMRYAAAVVAIDHGHRTHAKRLLQTAPQWPEGSAFRAFHDELSTILADGA